MTNTSQAPEAATFDTLEAAEAARHRLLDAGVDADAIELRVIAEDRPSTKGSFNVGNGQPTADSVLSIGGVASYPENFSKVETAGQCIVIVVPPTEQERGRIRSLLDA